MVGWCRTALVFTVLILVCASALLCCRDRPLPCVACHDCLGACEDCWGCCGSLCWSMFFVHASACEGGMHCWCCSSPSLALLTNPCPSRRRYRASASFAFLQPCFACPWSCMVLCTLAPSLSLLCMLWSCLVDVGVVNYWTRLAG